MGVACSTVGGVFGGIAAAAFSGDWEGTFHNPATWVGGAAHGGATGGVRGFRGIHGFNGRNNFEVHWGTNKDGSVFIPSRTEIGSTGTRGGFGGERTNGRFEDFGSHGSGSQGREHDTSGPHRLTRPAGSNNTVEPRPDDISNHESNSGSGRHGSSSDRSRTLSVNGSGDGQYSVPPRSSAVTNSASARGNSASGGGADERSLGGSGGPEDVRPVPGTDGSSRFQRTPTASGSEVASPSRSAGSDTNSIAGQPTRSQLSGSGSGS
ncbi:hypothetical protein ACW9HQ_40265, partial [Nocardia gipuzkoensis]